LNLKILLIQPPLNPHLIGVGSAYLTEPLALEIIAASVADHEVRILDMRTGDTLGAGFSGFCPDVVGITGNTADVYRMLAVLADVKKIDNSILTVAGGHHATMVPQDFNKAAVDVIVIGDGEVTFPELIRVYARKGDFSSVAGIMFRDDNGVFQATAPRQGCACLDTLPLPMRSLTAGCRNRYFRGSWRPLASIMTSRGCPFRCSFCALWKISGGRYMVRSPESVVGELETIAEDFIDFAEDNALHDVPRARKIAELISERGIKKTYKLYARSDTVVRHPSLIEQWKRVGMELVLIGMESFRDSELRGLNKANNVRNNEEAIRILHRNGVEIAAYFIIQPDYTEQDFDQLASYVASMNLTQPIFTVLTPLPGTDLYEQKFKELTTHNYELYDFVHPVLPTKLPLEKFYACLLQLYSACYSRPGSNNPAGSNEIFAKMQSKLMNAHAAGC